MAGCRLRRPKRASGYRAAKWRRCQRPAATRRGDSSAPNPRRRLSGFHSISSRGACSRRPGGPFRSRQRHSRRPFRGLRKSRPKSIRTLAGDASTLRRRRSPPLRESTARRGQRRRKPTRIGTVAARRCKSARLSYVSARPSPAGPRRRRGWRARGQRRLRLHLRPAWSVKLRARRRLLSRRRQRELNREPSPLPPRTVRAAARTGELGQVSAR